MSHLFLTKELDGYAVTFLRFAGPERFIVQVNGVERTISRDDWAALPVRSLGAACCPNSDVKSGILRSEGSRTVSLIWPWR
jgi:hypothetical protein